MYVRKAYFDVGEQFRDRLRNWGDKVRDKRRAGTSNLYPILRELWLLHGILEATPSTTNPEDIADAAFIDAQVLRLGKKDRETLIGFYCRNRSLTALAHEHRDFVRTWHYRLSDAERNLKKLVDNIENPFHNDEKLERA